jgi:hypothetical protein
LFFLFYRANDLLRTPACGFAFELPLIHFTERWAVAGDRR